jgi:mono/diheme cytochrome c family protein
MNAHRLGFAALPLSVALCVAGLVASGALSTRAPVFAQAAQQPAPDSVDFYTTRVQPILSANCYRCHAGLNHRGGLSMATRDSFLKGGHDGAVIVPGHPEQSLLVKLIRHEGPANDPMPMPPKGKLSDDDIATITQWIQGGAVMPQETPTPQ